MYGNSRRHVHASVRGHSKPMPNRSSMTAQIWARMVRHGTCAGTCCHANAKSPFTSPMMPRAIMAAANNTRLGCSVAFMACLRVGWLNRPWCTTVAALYRFRHEKEQVLRSNAIRLFTRSLLPTGLILFLCGFTTTTTDPDRAEVVTTDVAHFWQAFDDAAKVPATQRVEIYRKEYFDPASQGLKDFDQQRR